MFSRIEIKKKNLKLRKTSKSRIDLSLSFFFYGLEFILFCADCEDDRSCGAVAVLHFERPPLKFQRFSTSTKE